MKPYSIGLTATHGERLRHLGGTKWHVVVRPEYSAESEVQKPIIAPDKVDIALETLRECNVDIESIFAGPRVRWANTSPSRPAYAGRHENSQYSVRDSL